MSKKLAAQALDALMSSNNTNSKISKSSTSSGAVSKKKSSSKTAKKQNKNSLPVTKTGLKKIKHEIRYGHSVRRQQEEAEAKINPLEKLKSAQEEEQEIVERNVNYYKITNRVSKKELELRKKIKDLRAKAMGQEVRKTVAEQDESDGEDY
ncbi:hypothetical protein BGZ88_012061 [Linnemannia elongata]|nr:hypothetical protein BGZ88_012061 [Linnemannia elongata]KAF9327713.1 hypothetical protein BGZ91_001333 [Linnemannia elongata]KAG0064244.1 hypothetical protein BGZ90_002301 [Linnemannia elongata]KAG0072761.1 hypothetical protein BGZ89_003203 [Linnemannia elongata]